MKAVELIVLESGAKFCKLKSAFSLLAFLVLQLFGEKVQKETDGEVYKQHTFFMDIFLLLLQL